MRILAIGDIVGEKCLEKMEETLKKLKEIYNIDFIIANGENITNARGIDKNSFERLMKIGINVVTMGNHTFSNKDIYNINDKRLIVPANYDSNTLNKGYGIFECKNKKIFVANLLGKKLGGNLNAFETINNIISSLSDDINIKLIDFHSEYGNEKRALAHMLKDKVSVVFGTHTHVATADENILYNGLGYITDLGMCGPVNSAIGYDLDFETERFLTEAKKDSILSSDDKYSFNSCLFEIDDINGKTNKIEPIRLFM